MTWAGVFWPDSAYWHALLLGYLRSQIAGTWTALKMRGMRLTFGQTLRHCGAKKTESCHHAKGNWKLTVPKIFKKMVNGHLNWFQRLRMRHKSCATPPRTETHTLLSGRPCVERISIAIAISSRSPPESQMLPRTHWQLRRQKSASSQTQSPPKVTVH